MYYLGIVIPHLNLFLSQNDCGIKSILKSPMSCSATANEESV